jgi:hypothetical protein
MSPTRNGTPGPPNRAVAIASLAQTLALIAGLDAPDRADAIAVLLPALHPERRNHYGFRFAWLGHRGCRAPSRPDRDALGYESQVAAHEQITVAALTGDPNDRPTVRVVLDDPARGSWHLDVGGRPWLLDHDYRQSPGDWAEDVTGLVSGRLIRPRPEPLASYDTETGRWRLDLPDPNPAGWSQIGNRGRGGADARDHTGFTLRAAS